LGKKRSLYRKKRGFNRTDEQRQVSLHNFFITMIHHQYIVVDDDEKESPTHRRQKSIWKTRLARTMIFLTGTGVVLLLGFSFVLLSRVIDLANHTSTLFYAEPTVHQHVLKSMDEFVGRIQVRFESSMHLLNAIIVHLDLLNRHTPLVK
jgi:hypothetical protein